MTRLNRELMAHKIDLYIETAENMDIPKSTRLVYLKFWYSLAKEYYAHSSTLPAIHGTYLSILEEIKGSRRDAA